MSESKLRVKDAGETDPIGLKYSIVQNPLTNARIKLFLQNVHLCVLSCYVDCILQNRKGECEMNITGA